MHSLSKFADEFHDDGLMWHPLHGVLDIEPLDNGSSKEYDCIVFSNGSPEGGKGGVVQILGQTLPPKTLWVCPSPRIYKDMNGQASYLNGKFTVPAEQLAVRYARVKSLEHFDLGIFPYYQAIRDGDNKDGHYTGFSNSFLWPLLHGLGDKDFIADSGQDILGQIFNHPPSGLSPEEYVERQYRHYKNQIRISNEALNHRFVPHIGAIKPPLLVQDYQCVGVGLDPDGLTNERYSSAAFTLHTPFPSLKALLNTKIGQTCVLDLPAFRDWLQTLLSYDVITLHREQDVKNMRDVARYVMGEERELAPDVYRYNGHKPIKIVQNTVGIEPQHIWNEIDAAQSKEYPPVIQQIVDEHTKGRKKHLFMAAHRRDYTKGILELAAGIRQFLTDHPEQQDQCTFLLIMQKTREELVTYKTYSEETYRVLTQLKKDFPKAVVFDEKGLPHDQLMKLMAEPFSKTVMCLATTTDGFNLTGIEALIAQAKNKMKKVQARFSLMISQGAGIADQLKDCADILPNLKPKTLAKAFHKACTDQTVWRAHLQKAVGKALSLTGEAFLGRLKKHVHSMRSFKEKALEKIAAVWTPSKKSTYSTSFAIEKFIGGIRATAGYLKKRPMFVLDMDGCVLTGYNLKNGTCLPFMNGENAQQQDIPVGSNIRRLLDEEKIVSSIFAKKSRDVRLPQELVHRLNRSIDRQTHLFDMTFLTSRSVEDVFYILKESGVTHPEKVNFVADSGASMYINGIRKDTRVLASQERNFLESFVDMRPALNVTVKKVLVKHGLSIIGCPDVYIEKKGIAYNLHYRGILEFCKHSEGSALDKDIRQALQDMIQPHMAACPIMNGKSAFKVLEAPAALEIKIADVDKGQGLKKLVQEAFTVGTHISHIIFAGDDINGTDRFAAAALPYIRQVFGIPADYIHVHHPYHDREMTPDHHKAIRPVEGAPVEKPALVVPTPWDMTSIIEKTLLNLHLSVKESLPSVHFR